MIKFGQTIRKLRDEKKLPLRTVAAFLDIDQAILSKIERGQRGVKRELVVKLADFFNVKEADLLVSWLSDKLVYEVENEDVALQALKVAEEKIKYSNSSKSNQLVLIQIIRNILKKDGRVANAWLFGSVARNEENSQSDIDILVEMNGERKYSMFDILDIAHIIETKIKRKVDLVEKEFLKNYAQKTANVDFVKIYG